jgi:putative NADH-flavin reductase
MRIAVFGGTGYAGGNIAREAAGRGHHVTSYSRRAPQSPAGGITYQVGSLQDAALVEKVAQDVDVIVIALPAAAAESPALVDLLPAVTRAAAAGGARLGLVGGAGSSLVAEGGPRLLDGADFPDAYKPEAQVHADVLELLQRSDEELDWFVVSPAVVFGAFAPGESAGSYRTGGDVLVAREDGSSQISGTDYALAFLDEIEQGNHRRRRFTVGH